MKKDPVLAKLEAHGQAFQQLTTKLDQHDQRFDRLEKRADAGAKKLIEHDGRLEKIEQRLEKTATRDQLEELKGMVAEVLVTVKRLDQERTVMAGSIARIHDKDAEQDTEILRIKSHVGMK